MHAEFENAKVVPSSSPVFLDLPLVLKSHAKENDAVNGDENLAAIANKQHFVRGQSRPCSCKLDPVCEIVTTWRVNREVV